MKFFHENVDGRNSYPSPADNKIIEPSWKEAFKRESRNNTGEELSSSPFAFGFKKLLSLLDLKKLLEGEWCRQRSFIKIKKIFS